MSINKVLGWAALVLGALAAGVVATRPVMRSLLDRMSIQDGAWRTTLTAGSADSNLYERAGIAIAGLYALSKQETIYYTAFHDSAGQMLDGHCDYHLSGKPLPARWWSLTLYGADNFLVDNPVSIYSRHSNNLEFESDGTYVVAISARAQARNWLPAPAAGEFSITARLYNPDPSIFKDLGTVALPRIERGNCR